MTRFYSNPKQLEQLHVGERAIAHIKQVSDGFRLRTSFNQSRQVDERHYLTFSMAMVEAVDFMLAAESDEGLLKITQHSRLATG